MGTWWQRRGDKAAGIKCFGGKVEQRSSQSNYVTRTCKDLQLPRLNTEHAKKSYHYSTVKIWNTIPTFVREVSTISRFEMNLKKFLKS